MAANQNWQQIRIVEKSIDGSLLTATSEYKFVFLYRFRIAIFQRSILFKTNNYHHGVLPWNEGPGSITPAVPLEPALSAGAFTNQQTNFHESDIKTKIVTL